MRHIVTLFAALALSACAAVDPQSVALCEAFCSAAANQAERCTRADRETARAQCVAAVPCARVVSVRDTAELSVCIDQVARVCGVPSECQLQFRVQE